MKMSIPHRQAIAEPSFEDAMSAFAADGRMLERYRVHEGPEGEEEELRVHDVACTRATTLLRLYESLPRRR